MKPSRKFALDGEAKPNPSNRSGCFQLDGDPEEDGRLGLNPFVGLWTGLATLDAITTHLPPSNALVPFYFADTLPFYWSK
jgi:hypothetical protein